jgi:hypothetical protein
MFNRRVLKFDKENAMPKQAMIFCDFCGKGFEVDLRGGGAELDGTLLPPCGECAEKLKILDANAYDAGAAAEYFALLLLNGVVLKTAWRILMKRTVFFLALPSYAARLRARPSQRQDGKKGVNLSFAAGGAGASMTMPPIVMEVGGAETDGIVLGKPFYLGKKPEK